VQLGEFGVFTIQRTLGSEQFGAAARLAEELGFGALWLGGSPRLPSVRPMLEATERLIVATGIVNVWHYEPEQLASEFSQLTADFPDRLLLGVGIGHPESISEYRRPLATMRAFLDGLDGASTPVPTAQRCLAALGPKMLELSAQRSLGAHPYFTPAEHTRAARDRLGPSALLAPELACVLDADRERALATAHGYAERYLSLSNYRNNLLAHGFDLQDVENGGSQRLIDAVVPHGSAGDVAESARDHLAAGADHVCVQTVGVQGVPREEWAALAHELIG
jgi:probable F420-dependent oxidoreductase